MTNKNQRQKSKKYFPKKKTKKNEILLKATALGTGRGFIFCDAGGKQDYFIPQNKTMGALHGDKVLIKVLSRGNEQNYAEIVKIQKRANEKLVGQLVKNKGKLYFKADNFKISNLVQLDEKKTQEIGAMVGQKLVCLLNYQPTNTNAKEYLQGEIIEVLGDCKNTQVLEKAIMREYNIYENFPENVILTGETLAKKSIESEKKNRRDLTNEEIFTIDGEDAKDFDDAVSLSVLKNTNYFLGVHIADVGHYVKRESDLDKEAFYRGTSVYFPTMTFPMLPACLSNDACSLMENQNRLTLSVFMEINKKGDVVWHEIVESVIKSKARLTYNQVYDVLCNKPNEKAEKFKKTLKLMNQLSKILKQKRKNAGELDFDIPEAAFTFDEKMQVVDIEKRQRNDAHKLIESFMIVANETVAKEFFEKKSAFVYRVHEKPSFEKTQILIDFLKSLGVTPPKLVGEITPSYFAKLLKQVENHNLNETINKIVLRTLQKAKYSDKCSMHFGLALDYYCHFTSPIRRYPDLVIHRIIKDILHKKRQTEELFDFVFEASEQSSQKERNADEAERTADDLKKAEYMKKFVGQEFEGIISSVTNFGLFVQLENTVEGLVRIESLPKDNYLFFEKSLKLKGEHHTFSIGDKVKVVVASSNVFDRKIDFVIKL